MRYIKEYNSEEQEIKTCPFCGGNGQVLPMKDGYKVRCIKCDASVYEFTKFEEQAISKWNLRINR